MNEAESLNNDQIQKQEILHLLLWLSSHPAHQSISYIREALMHCMKILNLNEDEINFFANQIKIEAVVLGEEIPDDPQTRQVYYYFMKYLLRIKNQ